MIFLIKVKNNKETFTKFVNDFLFFHNYLKKISHYSPIKLN